jgi:hypothetical protein
MKTKFFWTLAASAITSLLVLAGCDTPVGDEGYWLAGVANPLIGTWSVGGTGMGTTATKREFKTDGTVIVTEGDTDPETGYYLVKDNILLLSYHHSPYYEKYKFTVIDNNTINGIYESGTDVSYETWVRVGEENPNADRTITLNNGLDGFWRSDSLEFKTEEEDMFMYDWYTFSKNGTFHTNHYMNKQKDYLDRGESGYFIDGENRLVALSAGYTVRVYYQFTKTGDDAFSWAETDEGSPLSFERFDGATFWRGPRENDPFSGKQWWQGTFSSDPLDVDIWNFVNNSERVSISHLRGNDTPIQYTGTYTLSGNNTITITPAVDSGTTGSSRYTYTFSDGGDSFTVELGKFTKQ